MFKMKSIPAALLVALTAVPAWADPTSYTLPSGVKVIDIVPSNAAGVSHNTYSDFNVDRKGLILNNSIVDVTNTHGTISKNTNLRTGSASVILNEVISSTHSTLKGFIEVNGAKADVIIANPNGIICAGCSFINTNKAILTTGKPNISTNGSIDSYTVDKGKIIIRDDGMYAPNSFALVMASAIDITGMITAQNASISSGSFTLNNKTGVVTSAGKAAEGMLIAMPNYSLDISRLGGIKANSISMVGNDSGFGVRNKGTIIADSSLAIMSNGVLFNRGTISSPSTRATQIVSAGKMTNTGTLSSNGTLVLSSNKGIDNEGTITTSRQLMLTAAGGNLSNSGTINGTSMLMVTTAGNLDTTSGSQMLSDNTVSITAYKNVKNAGTIKGKNTNIAFKGTRLEVSGEIAANERIIIQSVGTNALGTGAISNSGKINGKKVSIETLGNLSQSKNGAVKATDTLVVRSNELQNGGLLNGANSVDIANNSTYNTTGTISGKSVNIVTRNTLWNENNIIADNDMVLSTQGVGNIVNRGTISAGENLTMTAKEVQNGSYKCGLFNLFTCKGGQISGKNVVVN